MLGISCFGLQKPEIGLGITNNALLTDSNLKPDSYLWLKNLSHLKLSSSSLLFWFSYKDFSKYSANDTFSWKAFYSISNQKNYTDESSVDLGIGGQNYTSTNPESTDDGYDSVFITASWFKSINTEKIENLFFEPGYQFTRYEDSAKRNDHHLYVNAGKSFDLTVRTKLSPLVEIGFISSTDSIYRKNYFELGFDINWLIQEQLKLITILYNRTSWYPQRTLTSPRVLNPPLSNKKSSLSQSEVEAINLVHFEISLLKEYKLFSAKALITQTSQSSKSNLENYDELGAKIILMTSF